MPFCKNCGIQLSEGVKFCKGCGTATNRPVQTPPKTQPKNTQEVFTDEVVNKNFPIEEPHEEVSPLIVNKENHQNSHGAINSRDQTTPYSLPQNTQKEYLDEAVNKNRPIDASREELSPPIVNKENKPNEISRSPSSFEKEKDKGIVPVNQKSHKLDIFDSFDILQKSIIYGTIVGALIGFIIFVTKDEIRFITLIPILALVGFSILEIIVTIMDIFMIWWKITIRDYNYFNKYTSFPLLGKVLSFVIRVTEFFTKIFFNSAGFGTKWAGYVASFFIGYLVSATLATFRIPLSPIMTIMRYIKLRKKGGTKIDAKNRKILIGAVAGIVFLCISITVIKHTNFTEKKHVLNSDNISVGAQNPTQNTSPIIQPPNQTLTTNSNVSEQETTPEPQSVSQPENIGNAESVPSSVDNSAVTRTSNTTQETRPVKENDVNKSLPAFSVRLLREADICGLSKQELRLLRNEIYARHGYRFNTKDLREHFGAKDWYRPQHDDVDHLFNEYERANIKFIESHE